MGAALTDETKTGQLISGSHQVTEGVGKIHDSINVMLEALKSTDQQGSDQCHDSNACDNN